MSFERKNIKHLSKRCLLVSFLLFNLQAWRCGKVKQVPIGKVIIGHKGEATRLIGLSLPEFKNSLENHVDISKIDGDVLHTAIGDKDVNKVRLILERINQDLGDKSPSDVYKNVNNSDFPNACNKEGNTPFMLAIEKQSIPIINAMLDYSSFIDVTKPNSKTNETPLHLCIREKIKSETIGKLLQKLSFEDCFVKDKKNRDPLYLAARFKNEMVFNQLIGKIVDKFGKDGCSSEIKDKILSKDETNVSTFARILLPVNRGINISFTNGVDMFSKAFQYIKTFLNDDDCSAVIQTLSSEIVNLLQKKSITVSVYAKVNVLLKPSEVGNLAETK